MHLHINSCNLILFSVDVHCFLVMTSTWPICFFFALRPYDSVYLWATRWPLQAAFGWGAKRLGKPPRDLQLTGGLQDFYIFKPSYFFWQPSGRPSKKKQVTWGNDPIWRAYFFGDGLVQPPPSQVLKQTHFSFYAFGKPLLTDERYISLLIDHQNQLSKIDR